MMVGEMKWAVSLLGAFSFCATGVFAAEITADRTVYMMPMSRGLDQFVANRLTRMHVLQVVTDPAKAGMIFTDQVGAPFEERLKDLYPPPPDPAAKEKEAAAKKEAKPEKPGAAQVSLLADTVNKADKQGGLAVQGRGTIFLVDVRSRQVLWSAFERPKNSSPQELDHAAERIVKRLKEDLAPKTK